jgi:hypothetical protein
MARNRRAAAPVDFSGYASSRRWFEKQPREVAVTMAVRAALRVLPLLAAARDEPRFARLTMSVFRCAAVSWAVAEHPA